MKPDCLNCQAGKCNHLDTNADVTTQTHPYLTGAYEERMRIIELLENPYFHNIQFPDIHIDCEMCKTITLIKGENK